MRVLRSLAWGHAWLLATALLVTACGSHRFATKAPGAPKPSQESRAPKMMAPTLESLDHRLASALLAVEIVQRP